MGREVSCFFRVSEVMTPLVTSYNGRRSIAKLIAQPYFIIDWLLIALSRTIQSVCNLLMFLKLVELIRLYFILFYFFKFYFLFPLEHFRHQNN